MGNAQILIRLVSDAAFKMDQECLEEAQTAYIAAGFVDPQVTIDAARQAANMENEAEVSTQLQRLAKIVEAIATFQSKTEKPLAEPNVSIETATATVSPVISAKEPLAEGFCRTAGGHIKAAKGVLYKDPFNALSPEQQALLKDTPFGRPGGTGAYFADCHIILPPAWTVEELIHEGIIAVFSGAGAVGKSLVAIQIALCCAGGLSFLGRKCTEGHVLYINTEDPKGQNQRRLWRIKSAKQQIKRPTYCY